MLCKLNYKVQSTFFNLSTIGESQKISDPSTSLKCYWNLLKTLLNSRKIPCIPPPFHDNKFITDFKEKSEKSELDSNKAYSGDVISIEVIKNVYSCVQGERS